MSLVYAKSSLAQREPHMLESEVRSRGKSLTVAYLLWFFIGIFWVHRFYLKRLGGICLMASLVSLVPCIFLIGFLFLMILGFILLADAIRLSGFVDCSIRQSGTLPMGHWPRIRRPNGEWA